MGDQEETAKKAKKSPTKKISNLQDFQNDSKIRDRFADGLIGVGGHINEIEPWREEDL
jgi:hypothetical protein